MFGGNCQLFYSIKSVQFLIFNLFYLYVCIFWANAEYASVDISVDISVGNSLLPPALV